MYKKEDQLIFEAYLRANTFDKTTSKQLQSMRDYDLQCINELLQEAGFFDTLKKWGGKAADTVKATGQAIGNSSIGQAVQQGATAVKQGIQSAGQAVQKGVASITQGVVQSLVNTLISKIAPDQQKAFIDLISGKAKLQPNQVQDLTKQISATPVKESINSHIEYKTWLAHTLFTEENLLNTFKNGNILVEASNAGALNNIAKEMAAKIQALYPKNKKAMAAAIPKVTASLNSALGVTPSTSTQTVPNASVPTTAPSTSNPTSAPDASSTSTPAAVGGSAAANGGLLKQIMAVASKYPKMSAVTAAGILGITVAAFSSVGIVPMLLTCLSKAAFAGATGAATSVVKQVMAGQNVSGKQVVKDAAMGGAFGAAGAILGTGLSSLGKTFAGMFNHSGSNATQQASSAQKSIAGGSTQTNNNQTPELQRGTSGPNVPEPGSATSNHSNMQNNANYQHAIAQAAGLTHGEKFFLKQGIPYDAQGNRLNIDDETLDKLAAKYKQGAVMTKSAIAAAQERARQPVKPGGMLDF